MGATGPELLEMGSEALDSSQLPRRDGKNRKRWGQIKYSKGHTSSYEGAPNSANGKRLRDVPNGHNWRRGGLRRAARNQRHVVAFAVYI